MAKLGAALAASKTYREYSGLYLDELIHENGSRTELVNQNRLIKSLDGCFRALLAHQLRPDIAAYLWLKGTAPCS